MKPSIARIQAVMADAHKVPVGMMRARDGAGVRLRKYAWARQEAMFLCREMLADGDYRSHQYRTASLVTIGRHFGFRDHTTVFEALRKVEQRIAADPEVRRRIDSVSVGVLI